MTVWERAGTGLDLTSLEPSAILQTRGDRAILCQQPGAVVTPYPLCPLCALSAPYIGRVELAPSPRLLAIPL